MHLLPKKTRTNFDLYDKDLTVTMFFVVALLLKERVKEAHQS